MTKKQVDRQEVVAQYLELRNLRKTGDQFGISREWVRRIVNSAGIGTARAKKPKPEVRGPYLRNCAVCGTSFLTTAPNALYCPADRQRAAESRRMRSRIKADPEQHERWKQKNREAVRRYSERVRSERSSSPPADLENE